jgi:hypothetical protein
LAREQPDFESIENDLEAEDTRLVIHRKQWSVQVTRSEPLPFWILEQVTLKKSLSQICEEILIHPLVETSFQGDLTALVIRTFGGWVAAGMIQAVEGVPDLC